MYDSFCGEFPNRHCILPAVFLGSLRHEFIGFEFLFNTAWSEKIIVIWWCRNMEQSIESKSSLACSQIPTTRLYSAPMESYPHIVSPWSILISFSYLRLGLPCDLTTLSIRLKLCTRFTFPTSILHIPLILFSWISSP